MRHVTINNMGDRLTPKTSLTIHRPPIVNVNQILELQTWAAGEYRVVMKSGQTFTHSRGYREAFDAFFNKRPL